MSRTDKLAPQATLSIEALETISINTNTDGVEDWRGPLGLNLLYSPSEPLIDFVFVHGLGGGSRKTWSKTSSITHFWPQEWLPQDPAFENVRIHSFGYDSDWLNGRENCMNIHHFSKSLLGEIVTSPHLANTDAPMVLIGHSMGGLIIKKAYMLARQSKAHESLAQRIHSIYFLATPHRGANLAKLLGSILQITFSSRAYVSDLQRDSAAIQSINDEFRMYYRNICLWSFYETQKLTKLKLGMGVAMFRRLIVDPESATLGYGLEEQIPMNADHRSICKFNTPEDRNYISLRNALATTVNNISKNVLVPKKLLWQSQLQELGRYLGILEKPDDDLAHLGDARLPGTCEWFLMKKCYLGWMSFARDSPYLLWVSGKPATGKSILASYIVGQLKDMRSYCSYFFFRHGERSKSRMSNCLRSLAYQMACADIRVRETLLDMMKDNIKVDTENERALWKTLYSCGIFQVGISRHYWVIDALDECVDFSSIFSSMRTDLNESVPLRILVMSRDTDELQKQFLSLGIHKVRSEGISTIDTLPDIRLLVQTMAQSLLVTTGQDRAALVEKILGKSKGSFLWTVLVLKELAKSHSQAEINQALDEVPPEMELLYKRTLDLMSQVTRGKKLAKAILTWTTCAIRPLTIKELEDALKIDMGDTFPKLRESIDTLCGQLVTADRSGKVIMIHETAREYILKNDLQSEFAINKLDAHTRIARSCLTYLTGEEMKPPRNSRRPAGSVITRTQTEFSLYACTAFSYHLMRSDPSAIDIVTLLDRFLKSNVLSWIEATARNQNLNALVVLAKNIRTYFDLCSVDRSPLGREMQTIKGWSTDLIRIAAKFAAALVASPSSIYSLTIPFCPTESTVFRTMSPIRGLSVLGLSNTQWDDRLSCIDFNHGQTSSVCYGEEFIAVGSTDGTVALYHATTCQEQRVLSHGEAVLFLRFRGKTNILASCGLKTIRIWDFRSGKIIHSFQAPYRPIGLEFDKSMLMVASYKNYLASWDIDDGGAPQPHKLWNDSSKQMTTLSRNTPCAVSISISHKIVAVAYTGQSIMLWDLENDTNYGSCGKKLSNGETSTHHVTSLIFNPNRSIELLAASYLDGELVLLDPFADSVLVSLRADCHTLAASPDGRMLAGGAGSGVIRIYEFDTLKLLYQVKSSNFYIREISFSRDGLRFADIRGSQCNVWEPPVLLRNSVQDNSSECTSKSVIEAVCVDSGVKITAMDLYQKGGTVFCGKNDGAVCVYELKTGTQIRTLYRHNSVVRIINWWYERDILISIDASNMIFAWRLERVQNEEWMATVKVFQSRLDCGSSITQILLGNIVDKFILSTRVSDHFWTIAGSQITERSAPDKLRMRKWIQHPGSPLHMICFEGTTARIYSWASLIEVSCVSLFPEVVGLQLKNLTLHYTGSRHRFLLEMSQVDESEDTYGLYIIDSRPLVIESKTSAHISATPEAARDMTKNVDKALDMDEITPGEELLLKPSSNLAKLARRVAHIMGTLNSNKVLFLDLDHWVCSAALEDIESGNPLLCTRHFFIPYDWFSGTRNLHCAISAQDIIFARNDDVAVIRSGLEYKEIISIDSYNLVL